MNKYLKNKKRNKKININKIKNKIKNNESINENENGNENVFINEDECLKCKGNICKDEYNYRIFNYNFNKIKCYCCVDCINEIKNTFMIGKIMSVDHYKHFTDNLIQFVGQELYKIYESENNNSYILK